LRQYLAEKIIIVLASATAVPAGGFVFGWVHAEPSTMGMSGHIIVGVVFAILTTITMGYPPKNEGGAGEPWNAWPYILGVWGVILGVLIIILLWRYIYRLTQKS
jgi:protein-S-isoprenylcysteine O-methyltransferase Ste14